MQGHGEKITRKQEQAIAALLTEPTLEGAARAVGVNVATLSRWRQQPEFGDAYREARQETIERVTAHISASCSTAVSTLCAIMEDTDAPASARVSAARTMLEHAYRAFETEDLTARIATLERMLNVAE